MQTTMLALLGAALAGQAPAKPLEIGTPAGDFTLRDYRGAEHRLGDWRDKRFVVVAFLGVECPLAKLYARRLADIEKQYGPRGVAVVGIDANQHDTLRDLRLFARRHE